MQKKIVHVFLHAFLLYVTARLRIGTDQSMWRLTSTRLLWESLLRCWARDVYLAPLCHRFWKLSLQLLARYATLLADTQAEVVFLFFFFSCFLAAQHC